MGGLFSSHNHNTSTTDEVPYQIKYKIYEEVINAINKAENEEMEKRSPKTCRLVLYWFQNLIAIPEGVLRLLWHALVYALSSVLACCCFFCFCCLSDGENWDEENCSGATMSHHKKMMESYYSNCSTILGNLCHPQKPVWFYDLYTPITRPQPPHPNRGKGGQSSCCDECLNCCDECCSCCDNSSRQKDDEHAFLRLVNWIIYLTNRLLRSMYCAFSCHHACHGSTVCGPCCSCCRGCYEDLPTRTTRWNKELEMQMKKRTAEFFRETYGCSSYQEHCKKMYDAYLNPAEAQVIPKQEAMDRGNFPSAENADEISPGDIESRNSNQSQPQSDKMPPWPQKNDKVPKNEQPTTKKQSFSECWSIFSGCVTKY